MLLNLPLWSVKSQTAMFLLLPFSSLNLGFVSALLLWFPSHGTAPFVLLWPICQTTYDAISPTQRNGCVWRRWRPYLKRTDGPLSTLIFHREEVKHSGAIFCLMCFTVAACVYCVILCTFIVTHNQDPAIVPYGHSRLWFKLQGCGKWFSAPVVEIKLVLGKSVFLLPHPKISLMVADLKPTYDKCGC